MAAGEVTHTLSTTEMPSHNHGAVAYFSGTGGDTVFNSGTNAHGDVTMANIGGGGAHNNIQPSFVVYIWTRTA